MTAIALNLVTLCCATKSDLDVQRTHLSHWGQFVEQMLLLSLNFRCDQIYKYRLHDFGHTLLCYLSQTYMFNKLTSAAGTGRKKITKKCDQIDNN